MIDRIQEAPTDRLELRYAELLGSIDTVRDSPDRLAAVRREVTHIVFELLQRETPDEAA